ncbi:MAG: adenosine kinase [Chloroflexi bacterium]|jgi:sugar/nucleoside kinase (ribokinase family)|nr:adenosine kinase [Chloroflexota bacterium]
MNLEIIGIGSALVDITVQVDDSFLESENLPKGGMTLVDAARSKELLDKLANYSKELSPGGATANVMASFAHCGGKAGFIGKVGNDEMGNYFRTETEKAGATFLQLISKDTPTGTGLTLVTPDGQRTFATHLGAAVELNPTELPAEILNQAPTIHVEAYLVFNRELIDYILDTAKANGQKVSMDLSSFGVVQENLEYLDRISASHLDIVFANEDECHAFTGLCPTDSLEVFSSICEIAVVKEGEKGSHIAKGDQKISIAAERICVIDTNGAGDAYAGAVLYGLSKGLHIESCGRIGTKAGALAVSQRGARLTEDSAQLLREFASKIR